MRWWGGVNDLTDQVDELNSSLGGRLYSGSISGNSTVQLLWAEGTNTNSRVICFIGVRGGNAQMQASLILNGYGYGSLRTAVSELTKGSYVSYEIDDSNFALTITNSGTSSARLAIFMFLGSLPTISVIS